MVRFSKYVGSVRIQLILLKTENWKHCNKIIFKCVNSAVGPIFNIYFFLNKVVVGPVNSALCLLHCESMCMKSVVTVHMRWKKNWKHETQNVDVQYAHSKRARSHVNFFIGSCSLNLQPNLKPDFVNFLNWTINKCLQSTINRTLNYQGQGFSPN